MYHVILRGNHQQPVFDHETDYYAFEDILARALRRYDARVHAYCWMTNHVHLAAQVGEVRLGRLVQVVASSYARRKQQRVPTTGHLFERRYRAILVDNDPYWLTLVRYIHRNPVQAGIVADPADYRWSSHRGYLGRACPAWLTTAPTLAMFGGEAADAVAAYRRFVDEHAAPESTPSGAVPEPMPAFELADCVSVQALEDVVTQVSAELGVDKKLLMSARRDPALVHARLEIARQALAGGVASLATVATRLGRSASTLSEQLNRGRPSRRSNQLDTQRNTGTSVQTEP
jgi:REP element-mobilizing transposase RayT